MCAARPVRTLASAVVTAGPVIAGLSSAPKRCGELTCQRLQYCSSHVLDCRPCTEICTPDSKNYQAQTCDTQCQDYLHDMLKSSEQQEVMAAMARLEDDVERLTIMVGVMFCLLIVCFGWLVFNACASRRARCRRRKTADLESNTIELKKIGAKLANGSMAPPGPPVINPKANTVPQYTLGRHNSFLLATKHGDELKGARARHPSEDTCPGEYSGAAYDNPGLSVTPPPAAGGATGGRVTPPLPQPAPAGRQGSRDSQRPGSGVSRNSSVRTESTRLPREVDITDMSPRRSPARQAAQSLAEV